MIACYARLEQTCFFCLEEPEVHYCSFYDIDKISSVLFGCIKGLLDMSSALVPFNLVCFYILSNPEA